MRIVVSEIALESLITYSDEGDEHGRRVLNTIRALEEDGHTRQVLKLQSSTRPVWTQSLDDNTAIYYTYGQGVDTTELRIALVGPPPTDEKSDLRRVLYALGDVPYHDIPDVIQIDEHQIVSTRPELPERVLSQDASLKDYLAPSDDDLLDALSGENNDADDLNGRRYRILTALRSAQELPIRLSPQQERLLGYPLPLLFQGVAGSGKTTLVARFAHRQLLQSAGSSSVLIVTYTEELRQFIEAILRGFDALEPGQSPIKVRTWRNLCDELAQCARITPFDWAPESFFLDQIRFAIEKPATNARMHHLEYEIQEFIRAILKGQAIDPEDPPPPPRKIFFGMPQTPLDGQIDRGTIYDLAQRYQHGLAVNGLSDDTDAARQLLAYLDRLPKYDCVMVDEAQDYTLVQLLLLSRLCRRMEGLLFAGDVDQVVHSVDFTWTKARQAVWQAWGKPAPDPVTISYNYRNPQPVSELANAILEMRTKELGAPENAPALSNQALTPRPIRLVTSKAEADELIIELASKIGSLGIIQRDQPGRVTVAGIELERSFTPRQVKGLEFNVVCLINFNDDYRDLASGSMSGPPSRLRRQYNEVYVSVSRTRAQLLLIDDRALQEGLWDSPSVDRLIDHAEDAVTLSRLIAARFENHSRKDWELDALEFEAASAFAAAAECWERSGRSQDAARNYERAGRLEKALKIYRGIQHFEDGARVALLLGKHRDAAEFLELCGQFSKAADLWVSMRKSLRAAQLYERAAEQGLPGGNWSMAGEHYAASGASYEAAVCFEHACDCARAAENWLAAGNPVRAAEQFEQIGERTRAAESWLAAGEPGRAAVLFERAGEHARAAEGWLAGGEPLRAAEALDRLGLVTEAATTRARFHAEQGHFIEAAEQWLAAGEPGLAAMLLEQAGERTRAAESWLAAGKPARAAELWEQASERKRAAESWLAAGKPGRAAVLFRQVGDDTRAAESWLAAGEPSRAAKLFEKIGEHARAAESWLTAGEKDAAVTEAQIEAKQDGIVDGRAQPTAAGEIRGTADFRQVSIWAKTTNAATGGGHGRAAAQFEQAGNWAKAAECWRAAGEPGLAAARYEQVSDWANAAECWRSSRNHRRAAELFERADDWANAAESWLVAGEAIRAAVQLKRGGDMKGLTTLARRLEAQGHFRAAAAAYSLAGMRGKAGLMAFRRRLGQ